MEKPMGHRFDALKEDELAGINIKADDSMLLVAREDLMAFLKLMREKQIAVYAAEGFCLDGDTITPGMNSIIEMHGTEITEDELSNLSSYIEGINPSVNYFDVTTD